MSRQSDWNFNHPAVLSHALVAYRYAAGTGNISTGVRRKHGLEWGATHGISGQPYLGCRAVTHRISWRTPAIHRRYQTACAPVRRSNRTSPVRSPDYRIDFRVTYLQVAEP